jgi:DNA-directed RNA polymerase beta subunit
VDYKKSVDEIISTDLFGKHILDFFKKGGSITERSEQTNPMQMMAGFHKTTLIAPDFGGMKNEHTLRDEMRVINPSHFGFIDPMHTPESSRTGITLHLNLSAKKEGKELFAPVYDLAKGKLVYLNATDFHKASVVLPDQVRWEDGKPKLIADKVKTKMPGGDIKYSASGQYVMPSTKGVFGIASNLIPFLPCDQGNRVSMADKQMEQAISLKTGRSLSSRARAPESRASRRNSDTRRRPSRRSAAKSSPSSPTPSPSVTARRSTRCTSTTTSPSTTRRG